MRKISKPSTAQCNLEHYTLFLLSEPKHGGCSRLAEILGDVSHDSVNRFLLRERYEPKDLFDIVTGIINLKGGILSVDDTVIEKLYSNPLYAELISYFWSGKYHKTIKGLNLITIFYQPDDENPQEVLQQISRSEFITIHDTHWGIESFHRAVKQLCGICRFMVRDSHAIKTHIFCALQAFIRLEKMRSENVISNWYEVQRNLFTKVIREYVLDNLSATCAA
ncbi:MAG: hypothetical protein WA999_14605 [Spirulinaceae cyanobacterium]